MKKILLILLFLLVRKIAIAQFSSGENVVINDTIKTDFYVAGGTVTINAPVQGDLIVAGGTIVVNDTIAQDILVVGGNVSLNGVIADDMRCAGGKIDVNGTVLGDFIAAGGEILIKEPATIFGNVLTSGGKVTLNGNVKGNVKNLSETFVLNGTVVQKLEAKGNKIVVNGAVTGNAIVAANSIDLGKQATFSKNVTYWNKAGSLDFLSALQGGKAYYDPSLKIETGQWHYLGFASFIMALWYLGTTLAMMVLIQYLFSTTLKSAANTIRNTSLKSMGIGFFFLIGVPVAVVLLFVTVIGIPIGILLSILFVTLLLLATVLVSLLISNWINSTNYQGSWGNGKIIFVAFGIFIILKLTSFTPFIGPLLMLLLACMAFGGLLLNIQFKNRKAIITQ